MDRTPRGRIQSLKDLQAEAYITRVLADTLVEGVLDASAVLVGEAGGHVGHHG